MSQLLLSICLISSSHKLDFVFFFQKTLYTCVDIMKIFLWLYYGDEINFLILNLASYKTCLILCKEVFGHITILQNQIVRQLLAKVCAGSTG